MKKALKQGLAIFLAFIMVFGGAPLGALAGSDFSLPEWLKSPFSLGASAAHVWQVGDIGTFGSYPQTRVTDSATLSALNAQTLDWVSYGYYSGTGSTGSMTQSDYMKYADVTHGGSKYRAVKFTSYRPYFTVYSTSASNAYQDENGYYTNTTYWFKYEPLRWRVLDPSSGLVMCEDIIDSQAYSNTIYGSNPYYNNPACTTYANDYATSSMRTWLNDDFYNTAFTSTEQSDVKTTALDNSAYPGYSQYNSASTNDKLFLLSYSESTNTAYGFSSGTGSSATRYAQGSDYAKCQGLYVYNSPGSDNDKNSYWFFRSPGGYSHSASYVNIDGFVYSSHYVYYTNIGVRPAFKFSSLSSLSTISVTGVSLGVESLSLTVAETSQLTAEVQPSDATDKSFTWASSDTNVATVSATGLVTAVAPGTATITVTTNDGGFTDTCAVTVTAAHTWQVGGVGIFGSYPQTHVTDSATLSALNAKTLNWVSYGYYSGTGSTGSMTQSDYMKYADVTHGGSKYRAVKFTSYRPCRTCDTSSTEQDSNGYYTNTVYWFKYEPLRWRVLDPSSGLVMCEDIIDSQAYSNTIYGSNPYYNNPACTVYANDYATSSMRTWLNDNFYNTAFTSTEQSDVKTTALDNSAWPGYSQYNSASTNDKLFLLSYSESTNTAYGFSSSTGSSATRYAQGSDYAKCQGLYVNNSPGSDYDKNSVWFLRSPGGNSNRASYAYYNGYVNDYSYNVGDTIIGVCPALKLSSLSSLSTIPVTGVLLGEKSLSLTVAETSQLTAEVSPSDAADKSLTWASSDTNVATVSATGLVTAKAPGTATITVTTNDGGFTDTCAVTVSRINAGSFAVTDIPNQTYTGGELTPPVEVKFNGETLTLGTDYTVEYANNINVGTATATVTGKGNFEGAKAVTFTIVKASASGFAVTAIPNQTYTGGSIKPPVEVKFNGAVLTLGTDYTVEYANNINVGTATVTITGKGNFEGTKAVTFAITAANASAFTVTDIPDKIHTGNEITPLVEVKFNGAALTLGTDYTVEYTNNINVGTATATITGKGNFEGTKAVTFTIIAASASGFAVTDIPDQTYTGSEITPPVEVKFNGATLTLGTDYTVEYANNINVGTATVTITGKGNFEGAKAVNFTIVKASASGFAVTAIPNQTYTGGTIKPPVEVKFNGAALTLGTDYIVEYKDNINVGTATATITGKGNFEGTKAVTFTIVKASAGGFAVTDIPNQTYTGNELTPPVEVKFNGTTLTLGTDYTVEYANNINVGTATVTITGKGNFEGEKAVTFTIVKASASGFAVTDIPNQTHTGDELTPPVEVKFNGETLTLGTDYTVEYRNNINVGRATVTITGAGNFEGVKTVNFTILAVLPKTITMSDKTLELICEDTAALTANIEPHNTTNKNIIWTSSDEKVATVDANGKVTATGRGTATITATVEFSDVSDTCTVTVKLTFWQWIVKMLKFVCYLTRMFFEMFKVF